MREQLVRDGRDGVGREPMPDAAESDETSVRDLGGERLTIADREERVVLACSTSVGAVISPSRSRQRGPWSANARLVVAHLTSVVLATSASA